MASKQYTTTYDVTYYKPLPEFVDFVLVRAMRIEHENGTFTFEDRYVIIDLLTGEIYNDHGGTGYKTFESARNEYFNFIVPHHVTQKGKFSVGWSGSTTRRRPPRSPHGGSFSPMSGAVASQAWPAEPQDRPATPGVKKGAPQVSMDEEEEDELWDLDDSAAYKNPTACFGMSDSFAPSLAPDPSYDAFELDWQLYQTCDGEMFEDVTARAYYGRMFKAVRLG